MTDLIPVPRYGDRAVLILQCGHRREGPHHRSDHTVDAYRFLLFNCLEGCGCGLQPVTDLIVWKP